MQLDGRDRRSFSVKSTVVTEHEPVLGPNDLQPLVIWHFIRKFICGAVVIFDIEGCLHLKQGFGEALAETPIKIKRRPF